MMHFIRLWIWMVSVSAEWTMPAVSNYSEWVFPEIAWISDNTVFMPSPEEGGQLDDLTGPYRLTRIVDGQQEVLAEDITPSSLRCSPSGERCLTGYAADNIIDAKTGEQTIWIRFSELKKSFANECAKDFFIVGS